MPYLSKYLLVIFIILTNASIVNSRDIIGQEDTLNASGSIRSDKLKMSFQAQGISTPKNFVPFWMRANQYGSVPLKGFTTSFIGRVSKDYSLDTTLPFDWAAAVETRLNVGSEAQLILVEGYVKAKLGIFEFRGGRSKDMMGLTDSTLSSGAFAMSGNALGIPKIQVSFPDYYSIPIFNKLISFKGNFAYGWFGPTPLNPLYGAGGKGLDAPLIRSFFHQKSFYGRIGQPNWRLKFFGGFNHQTMYGNENQIYTNFNLTKLQSFYHAVTGKTWVANSGYKTKLGNQLGSIDIGLTYDLNSIRILVYRQQFYDVGALAHLANLRDNLTGISFTKKKPVSVGINKLLLEFLFTKNQAGELWSKFTPSGDEAYYNSNTYEQGWSYAGKAIGNPFLTPRSEARSDLRYKSKEYFVNNRVIAFHTGFDGNFNRFTFKAKFSYSNNYGTYGTSSIGSSLGDRRNVLPPPYFEKVTQFSGYLEGNRNLTRNWQVGVAAAYDHGGLLYNSFGVVASVKKSFFF